MVLTPDEDEREPREMALPLEPRHPRRAAVGAALHRAGAFERLPLRPAREVQLQPVAAEPLRQRPLLRPVTLPLQVLGPDLGPLLHAVFQQGEPFLRLAQRDVALAVARLR